MNNTNVKIIGIKQLHKDLKKISRETSFGQSFMVVKNSKAVFRIEPLEEKDQKRKFSLDDFKKIQFEKGDKDISKEVDELIY